MADADETQDAAVEEGPQAPRRRRDLFQLRTEPSFPWGKLLGALFVGLVLLVWWILTAGDIPEERIISPAVLPSPGEVFGSLSGLVDERGLFPSVAATLRRVLFGFGLAIAVGVPLGVLAAAWRPLGAFLAPLVIFGRNTPIAALIPLTMLWFGIDEGQKVVFIFIATVPFIFSDAAAAVMDIHQRYVETAQTLGASRRQIILKVLVPLSLPQIFGGLRTLFGLAFGYIMLAELVNAEHGLGHLIFMSQRRAATADIFMVLIIIALIAYGIDRGLAWFQKGLFPYRQQK